MDLEAPIDAWYVWVAVAIVSIAIFGVALAVPSGPPPDANAGANAIDRVGASPHEASATVDHDGEGVRLTATELALRNDHGTSYADLAYGGVVPARGVDSLENVTHGAAYEEEYAHPYYPPVYLFLEDVDDAHRSEADEWATARGDLTVRHVRLESGLLDVLDRLSIGDFDVPAAVTTRWDGVHYDSTRGEFYVVLVDA